MGVKVEVSNSGRLWVDANELLADPNVKRHIERFKHYDFNNANNLADKYQEFTNTTAVFDAPVEYEYLHFGLVAEVGELFDEIAKTRRDTDSQQPDSEKIKKELGDICWFVARLSDYYGFSLSSVLLANRDKLIDRQNRNKLHGSGDDR